MTDSDVLTLEWKPIPGAGYYEASHRGQVRSVDRVIDGKQLKGVVLKTRLNNSGYKIVNVRRDDRTIWTGTVHGFVLLAHAGEPPPGQEALHGPAGQLDNRWPENIRYGTHEENVADRMRDNPRRPEPPKVCPRCETEHAGTGQRGGRRECHDCRLYLGVLAAESLAAHEPLQRVADWLDYPAGALFDLAVKHGGLRMILDVHEIARVNGQAESPKSWLHRVINRAKATRRNSDVA